MFENEPICENCKHYVLFTSYCKLLDKVKIRGDTCTKYGPLGLGNETKQILHHTRDFKEGTVAGYPLIVCPECGSELTYSRYVGFLNGDAYHEYDCTNPECDFTGRIFKENIYE